MLKAKKAEFVKQLAVLEQQKTAIINEKVAQFKQELETTVLAEDINKVKHVIIALDEVITYETSVKQLDNDRSVLDKAFTVSRT